MRPCPATLHLVLIDRGHAVPEAARPRSVGSRRCAFLTHPWPNGRNPGTERCLPRIPERSSGGKSRSRIPASRSRRHPSGLFDATLNHSRRASSSCVSPHRPVPRAAALALLAEFPSRIARYTQVFHLGGRRCVPETEKAPAAGDRWPARRTRCASLSPSRRRAAP